MAGQSGGVIISGSANIGGDVAGRDLITDGDVVLDFMWGDKPFKALCPVKYQRQVQKQIDRFIAGKIDANELLEWIKELAPSMMAPVRAKL